VLQELLQNITREVKGCMGFVPGAIEKRAASDSASTNQGQQLATLRELSEPLKSMLCSSISTLDKENAFYTALT